MISLYPSDCDDKKIIDGLDDHDSLQDIPDKDLCHVVCVRQPGGPFVDPGSKISEPGNGAAGDEGGSRDGYTKSVVPVLEGGKVAEGTTKNCGRYVQAGSGVGCPRMLAKRAVPMDLFLGKEDMAKAKTKE
ncbi:hypothetical protein MY3296_009921 [Beauveria thailandica]